MTQNRNRTFVTLAALGAFLGSVTPARAGCAFDLIVQNNRAGAVVLDKVSTSTSVVVVPVYKQQWTGAITLEPGTTTKLTFTVDSCPSSKSRSTKVFFHAGSLTFTDVEHHATGETQTLE